MSVSQAKHRPPESSRSSPARGSRPATAVQPEATDIEQQPLAAEAFRTPPQRRPALDGKHAAPAVAADLEDPKEVRVHVPTPVWQGDARRTELPSARRVFATLTPWHRLVPRRLLITFTPIAGVAASIASYSAYRQPTFDTFADPDTYTGHGSTDFVPIAVGVAGLVGGVLLPWAIAGSVRAGGQCRERLKDCRGAASARQKMNELVKEATDGAPLTRSGLDSCFNRLDELARHHGLAPVDHAAGLAQLTTAAAKRGTCAPRSPDTVFTQLDHIISALGLLNDKEELEVPTLRSALLDIARRIGPATPISVGQRTELAYRLVDEFDRALDRSHTNLERRQQVMDFKALLSGLPTMHTERMLQQHTDEELEACGARDLEGSTRQVPTRMPLAHTLQALREAPASEVADRAADAVQAALADPPGATDPTATSNVYVLALASVSDALRARTDVPAGALLGGVLDPILAIGLLRRVQWTEHAYTEDLTNAVFKVANLCQCRATRKLHELARQTADALWNEDIRQNPDRSNLSPLLKSAQQLKAPQLLDGRLSVHPGLGTLGERLHLPWLR